VDLSIRRVLEGLRRGPATPRILTTSYGMGIDESEEALAQAIDDGLVEQIGVLGFGLTADGAQLTRELTGQPAITAQDLRDAGTREEHRDLQRGDRHATIPVLAAGARMHRGRGRTSV
jgi:hypothetical protein